MTIFDAMRSFGVAKTPPFDIFVRTCGEPWKRTKKKMPLHRDIFWVGKQWAVTGYGVQACDQKQKSKFDIEASRLWEDGLSESMHAHKWLNIGDFDKALAVARTHYPEPPRTAAPALAAAPPPENATPAKDEPKAEPASAPKIFTMRFEGCRARFLPTWRIRVRSQH